MTEARRATNVFINLPVADVKRAQSFFEDLGFSADPRFTSEDRAACITFSDTVSAMLLNREAFKAFASKPLANAASVASVITCLQLPTREAIDTVMNAALASGATETRERQDQARMYGRAFEDLDGHLWELLWIDT